MSRYTRGYDVTNRNSSDFSTTSYESPRLYEHSGRPKSELISPPFEFGVSYKTPKSYDVTTKTYDKNTGIGDATTQRSPARTTSLSDKDASRRQVHGDAPLDRNTPRLGSGDSSGSQSSEKLSSDDKSLFGALKHRYQETAEKQYDDPSSRTPFSSWRRSGNFEDVTAVIAPETKKEKTKSLERKTYHRDADKSQTQRDSYYDEPSGSRSGVKDTGDSRSHVRSSPAPAENQPEKSTDELIFNFRQAFCRHALSERDKAQNQDHTQSSHVPDLEDDATAQRLERLRAARAKIHEQRQTDKVHSQSFATEFKLDKSKIDKNRSGSTSSVSSQKSDQENLPIKKDREKTPTERSYFEEAKSEAHKHKQSTKLARQKLVSDELRAKYMIKRDENDKEKTPTLAEDSSFKSDKHRKAKDQEVARDVGNLKSKHEPDNVPTMEEMLLGSVESKKSSSLPAKSLGMVDHSSPFGSVYSKPSTVTTTTTTSATSASPAVSVTASSHIQPTKTQEKSENEKSEKKVEMHDESHGERKYKKYAKAKTLELGELSKEHEQPEKIKPADSKDDLSVNKEVDEQARFERIAKYKEERKKQIKSLQDKFTAGGGMPSLFLSSKPEKDEDASVSRSKSMKVESETKLESQSSNVARSRSLKHDKEKLEIEDRPSSFRAGSPKMSGLRLAEIGAQKKHAESHTDTHPSAEGHYDADNIIEKIHALKKLKADQIKRSSGYFDDSFSDTRSVESEDDKFSVHKPPSYATKSLLADRAIDDHSKLSSPSPGRERVPSDSKDRELDRTYKSHPKPEQKSYFEFGTVFTKKEKPEEKYQEKIHEEKVMDEKESDSGRESVDSGARIRRRLPSVEDVLGTNVDIEKFDKMKKDIKEKKRIEMEKEIQQEPLKHLSKERIEMEKEIQQEPLKHLSKEEIQKMSADEINRRKISENIEKAKYKFKEDEKHAGKYDSSKFELGTVYTSKKVDQPVKPAEMKFEIEAGQPEKISDKAKLESVNQSTAIQKVSQIPVSPKVQKKSHRVAKKGTEEAQIVDSTSLSQQPSTSVSEMSKKSHKSRREARKEKLAEKAKAEHREEAAKIKEKKATAKPPSSPRQERKAEAEQKFGKASYRSNEPAFEFGTSYSKKLEHETKAHEKKVQKVHKGKEPEKVKDEKKAEKTEVKTVSSEEKSKPVTIINPEVKRVDPRFEFGTSYTKKETAVGSHEAKPSAVIETVKPSVTSSSQVVTSKSTITLSQAAAKAPVDTQAKFDIRMQTVSTASGRKVEVPAPTVVLAQRERSPDLQTLHEVKPMKVDVKSSRTQAPKENTVKTDTERLKKIETLPTVDKKTPEDVKPVKQTSVKSFDIKTQKSENVDVKSAIEAKPVTGTPKERSEFTFETTSKQKGVPEEVTSQQRIQREQMFQQKQVQKEQLIVQKEHVTQEKQAPIEQTALQKEIQKEPARKLAEPHATVSVHKEEAAEVSVVEKHKKFMEEKIEQQKLVFIPREEPVEKHEKKSELFELHMKQIAEKLEPKHASQQVEEKVVEKHEHESEFIELQRKLLEEKLDPKHVSKIVTEEKPVEKHDVDSQLFKMHKKEIVEKLELKEELPEESATAVTETEKPRSRKIVKHRSEKAKVEKPVQAKVRMEKSLMDTSLDDLLSKNVEYLSDLEPPEFKRGREGGRKERPQSIHEPHRVKRVLKKKSLSRRSKSEDRSHFKQVTSDDDCEERSKVAEDVPRSPVIVTESYQNTFARPAESRYDSRKGRQKATDVSSQQVPQEKDIDKPHHKTFPSGTIQDSQNSLESKPVSRQEIGVQRQEITGKYTQDEQQTRGMQGISKPSSSVSGMPHGVRTAESRLEQTAEVVESVPVSEMFGRTGFDDRSGVVQEGEVTKVGTDSDHSSVSSSATSEGSRRRRKDKSSLRKSKLNESSDDTSVSVRRGDSSDDSSRGTRTGVRRIASSRLARESKDSRGDQPEVSAAISRLTESSEKEGSQASKKLEEHHAPRIRRGNNFSDLLQKFSGSEASSSEKSDGESPRRGKVFLKRQEACRVSSGSSDDTRRTPERTQSLKIAKKETPAMESDSSSSVLRSSSFKSDFMKRRFSPEPDNRRRLPETPQEQSDKPSPELANVLNKRSEVVSKQQLESEPLERQRIHDGRIERSDKFSARDVDEVIADSEVVKMLKSRRKETDSSVDSVSETDKSQKMSSSVQYSVKPDTKTTSMSQSSTESDYGKRRLQSQSSVESKLTVNLSSKTESAKSETPSSQPYKSGSAKVQSSVPHLDLSSIDTSLDVLKTVTADLDDTHHDKSTEKLTADLSHIKVTSPTQVAQFIKSVESETHHKELEKPMRKTEDQIKEVQSKTEKIQRPSSPTSAPQGSINIANKSEIMRKISTRDRTPERQSPKRTGPMKVMSPATPSGAGLTRTESVGRSESERPKGILKRTPSLKQSGVIVDPELAEVLKSRRQKQDDVEEEEEEKKLTAEEEIRQAREEAASSQQDEDGREVSVAERIFQMHNKIEEVKSCPITPKPRSGFTTPKSALQRSGDISPKQYSFEDSSKQSELSGSQLIEKLSSLEGRQSSITEKRQKFLARHRDIARTRTQPVTQQEIQIADSLETVRKFRQEVIKKASTNAFATIQKELDRAPAKKTEFPQQLPIERRPRGLRHKTTPVTAAELNAIPEDKPTETMYSLRKKFDMHGARDSRGDSGILSGSDGDFISQESESWRSLSVEENISEDDPVKLSVSAKASMFHQIQESLKEKPEKKSASGAKRYIDRKKRERSRTLPITEDEVKLAAEIADKEEEEKGETTPVTLPTEQGEGEDDELSRQSLKDKVKLFASIEEEKKAAAKKKGVPPPPRRKNRKVASRFATQPITIEEVEKAATISPLACSLVKPPDPEILSGLSIKAQQELIAQYAQQTLSQPGSRAGSRGPSRATSIGDLSGDVVNRDELTAANTDRNTNSTPVESCDTSESLRPSQVRGRGFELKHTHSEEYHSSQVTEKVTVSNLDSQKKSILKSQLEEKLSLFHKAPVGLLKPDSHVVPTISDINKVLKKDSFDESAKSSEVKGILKKEGSFETSKMELEKSAIQSSDLMIESLQETASDDNLVDSSGDNLDSDEGVLGSGNGEIHDAPVKRRDQRSRRRFNRERKLEQERYKTQPAETSTPDSEDSGRLKKKYSGRHFTQPVTPDEKKEATIATEMPEISKTGSITERLNALKKSGDEDWKKRVSRPVDLDRIDRRSASPETPLIAGVKMREKKALDVGRPSSIADRMSLLDSAQEGWRDRVGETDVKKFTIEHKISASGQSIGESPLVARLRGKGLRSLSRDSESSENSDLISPTTPTKPAPREIVCTDLPAELLVQDSKSPLISADSVEEEKGGTTVSVPEMGEEIESFFHRREAVEVKSAEMDVSVDDFNELFLSANDMLEAAKRVKPKRRYKTKSSNPLKTMSACLEVKSEYTEVIHGVAERELKSAKVAALQQNSGFAVEALAGLASKENFAKVELRKTESNGAGTSRLDPYLPIMLIHIKGRRKVQCRLVEPTAESINSGDCYVLVTNDRVIQWIGDFCNVIEKAKAADVCDFVKQKRDLGCKNAREIITVEEKKGILGNARHFWEILGGHKPYMACGPTEEDELYETHIVETNMIYQLENNKLVPVQDAWGTQPKYEMLTSDQVYVFDFGSELYVWQGKSVSPNQRKVSVRLAEQLWQQGYDYSQCDINPLSPLKDEDNGGLPSQSDQRPDWALFGKVNQNMETILFREKFADWPDTSRLIKVKSQEDVSTQKLELADLKAYDAKLMVPVDTSPVNMVLEGSSVGRGVKWETDMEGFVREQEIQTLKVRVWHVLEYEHYEIEDHSFGQFHEGDTYVIRWQYMIVNAGMKSLKGEASRFGPGGRERCAYFFWQGKMSTINEKGASALMTVELDEERGPQVRVPEGKEPPCFLNLFQGRMIIHIGKREEEETNTQGPWRFYCLRNEYENEMCLIEVPKDISNLRSVSSCLILNIVSGKLTVWHGCKSPEHTRKLARKAAENLKERCPLEVGLYDNVDIDVVEVEEGEERVDFWRMMNVHIRDRSKYHCLLNNPESFNHTLRLFHMTSVSGMFEAHENLNPSRTNELPTKFPVLRADLYNAQQPALFLIDNGHEVYLWQGWWPEGGEDQENVLTGSAQTRFTVDRRCAMETTLAYCKEINPDNPPPAYMVYAGLEPLSFTNLFPFWSVDENVRELNLKLALEQDTPIKIIHQDGRTEAELVPVQDLLKKLTKTRYTLAELLETPLPEGVDPMKLESYLSDEEFEAVLEMTREEFYALPSWKQQKMKQQASLF